MGVLDLLLSRRALAAGVGLTTRRNKVLPPAANDQDIPQRVGIGKPLALLKKLRQIYMTSGAYAFGANGGINTSSPLLTIEPITYKSSAVAAAEAADLSPHYDKTPPANGEVSKIYNHTINPGGLNAPKTAMLNRRPSEFSGLMRRCMQGRYGVGNTSENMCDAVSGGSVTVGSSFGRTTGILRFGSTYFLVALTCDSGSMSTSYWPLIFTDRCRDMMTSGYSAAIETLALAYAYVIEGTEVSLGTISIANGSPIAYGWNFSLTGNTATCVVNEMQAYGYDRRQYRRMSLTFSYNSETQHVSLAYALDEDVDGWIPPAIAPIWSPVGGETIWYNQRSVSPTPTSNQDFPVHSFYVGDTLRVVRWKWVVDTRTFDESELLSRCTTEGLEKSVFGQGTTSYDQFTNYGTVTQHGFYVAGVSDPIEEATNYRRLSSSATWTLDRAIPGAPDEQLGLKDTSAFVFFLGVSGNSFNPRIAPWTSLVYQKGPYPADPLPYNHYSGIARGSSNGVQYSIDDAGSSNHVSSLVIPATDCSAAYIGTRKTTALSRTRVDRTYLVGTSWLKEWYLDGSANVLGVWYDTVLKQFSVSWTSSWGSPLTSSSATTSETETVNAITLYAADSTAAGDVDSLVFHPSSFNLSLPNQVQTISSSLNSDKRYHKDTLTSGEVAATSGYPTDITLFVGSS